MRTILHIGMPKTGTTALQSGLASARDHLTSVGILFPENPPHCAFRNHNLLAAGFADPATLPRQFRNKADGGPDALREQYREFVAHAEAQVAARRPDCMVLSSEVLFRPISAADHAVLAGGIGRFGGPIRVVAYLRAPADYYVSSAQQILRAAHTIKPLKAPRYAGVLSSYVAAFGPDAVAARAFDRSRLVNGDVIDDFIATALAGFGVDAAKIKIGVQANETISAEAMILLRGFRATFHKDEHNVYSQATSELIRALLRADRIADAPRPRLRPEYADFLNHSQRDPLLVRDAYGVEFPGVDYRRLARGELSALAQAPRTLRELFVVDEAKLRSVAGLVAGSTWAGRSPERARWIRDVPDAAC